MTAMRRSARLTVVALLSLGLSGAIGCGAPRVSNGVYKDASVHYAVGAPGAGWREIVVDDANAAWFHEQAVASLLVSSHCEGVDDAPLEALTRHLTIGMTEVEIIGETRQTLSRREALETELSAKLDGVPRRQTILVLKKDGCVYDIVLDASPDSHAAARAGYESVKQGFVVEPRPGRSS